MIEKSAERWLWQGYFNLEESDPDTFPAVIPNTLKLYAKDVGGVSTLCYMNDDQTEICLDGTGGVTDHGALTGLSDNDHPQYLRVVDIDDTPVNGEVAQPISSNWAFDHLAAADPHSGYLTQAEADALYSVLAHGHDHGALTGLADDDHPQYALDTDLTAHAGAADPHAGYRLESADHTHASTGAQAGQLDHGAALTGLSDNDHPQYLLVTDIDDTPVNGEVAQPISSNWAFDHVAAADPHPGYLTQAEADALYSVLAHTHDHGALTGLTDDDHSIYALLAGRSGGQTLNGGTLASNKLILHSTAHATKGDIDLHAADVTHLAAGRFRMASQNRFRHLNSMTRLAMSGDQAIATATITPIDFAAEDFDTDGLHDTSSNNSRITITLAGKYLIGGLMRYDQNSTGSNRQARIHKNGTIIAGGFANDHSPKATQQSHVFAVIVTTAIVGDYFEFAAYQDSGGNLNVESSQTTFYAVYLGE